MELNPCPLNEIKEKVIKVLNEARCLEGRTVGNTELASRILDIPEVKQAVERMKPKKVIYDDSRLGKPGITEYSLAICPSCKQSFIFDENATEFKYCPNCGQALDLSE